MGCLQTIASGPSALPKFVSHLQKSEREGLSPSAGHLGINTSMFCFQKLELVSSEQASALADLKSSMERECSRSIKRVTQRSRIAESIAQEEQAKALLWHEMKLRVVTEELDCLLQAQAKLDAARADVGLPQTMGALRRLINAPLSRFWEAISSSVMFSCILYLQHVKKYFQKLVLEVEGLLGKLKVSSLKPLHSSKL